MEEWNKTRNKMMLRQIMFGVKREVMRVTGTSTAIATVMAGGAETQALLPMSRVL